MAAKPSRRDGVGRKVPLKCRCRALYGQLAEGSVESLPGTALPDERRSEHASGVNGFGSLSASAGTVDQRPVSVNDFRAPLVFDDEHADKGSVAVSVRQGRDLRTFMGGLMVKSRRKHRTSARNVLIAATLAALTATAAPPGPAAAALPTSVLLYNITTNKCIDVPGHGAGSQDQFVNQYTCTASADDNMLWEPQSLGTYHGWPLVRFKHRKSPDLCLDLPFDGWVKEQTRVSLYPCRGPEDNQEFYLKKTAFQDPRGIRIVHRDTELCLDVAGHKNRADWAPITLYTCSILDDHEWDILG